MHFISNRLPSQHLLARDRAAFPPPSLGDGLGFEALLGRDVHFYRHSIHPAISSFGEADTSPKVLRKLLAGGHDAEEGPKGKAG